MKFLALLLAGCASVPHAKESLPEPPPCLVWSCDGHGDCEIISCEDAIPIMERQLCLLVGRCVQV